MTMEEFTLLQSMLNTLNSNNPKKKAIIEILPVLLETYDLYKESTAFNVIVSSTRKLCNQVIDPQFENSAWKDSDVSLDNLKSLLINFFDIINKHSDTDTIQLFQYCVELSNIIDFKQYPNERIKAIGFCMQKLYLLCDGSKGKLDDCKHLDDLKNTLINVINDPYLNKNQLDGVLVFLNNIVSIHYVPTLWENIKPMIKTHPDRVINILFNMQFLFFDSECVDVILNDGDFWDLLCKYLMCENNVIRSYSNVILKLSCSLLLNENLNYFSNKNKEEFMKMWNDYVIVIETLENTQQHLTLPILNTAKNIASNNINDNYNNCTLPLKWITAMYCKMSKHSSKYVVLASIDIITNMSMKALKTDEHLLRSFVDSLNNIFLYKMSNEINISQPDLENILSLWFDKLMVSNDGLDVFSMFLSFVPRIKWSIVPLIFLTKSLANVSSNSPLGFNIIDYVLNIKNAVQKLPNSHLKTVALSFLYIFTSKFFANVNFTFTYDLLECISVYPKNTTSWNYVIDSIRKINILDHIDNQLSLRINEKHKIYSTSIGLLILSNTLIDNPVCTKKLDEILSHPVDVSDLLDLLEGLLEIESNFGEYSNHISTILNKHTWPLTSLWVEKCFQTLEESSYDEPIVCKFLDKVLSSARILNTTKILNIWLKKCNSILLEHSGNHSVLAIYSWIGKYATRCSTEHSLKNDWLSFTKYFIELGFFSLKNQGFYQSKKPGMHTIPQLDIMNTFFQYSSVPEEQMLIIFDWLTEKTIERQDSYWSIYFSTAKIFLSKFPLGVHTKKVVQFIQNCWEFLVDCRVSCFPNATKSFIEMTFNFNLMLEENYLHFIKDQIIQNILTSTYRDKFNVCFSLLLLEYFEKHLSNVIENVKLDFIISEFFAKCLLFHIDRYGAIKIEWDTLEYIRTLKNIPLVNDIPNECLPDDKYLRFNTIKCLCKLNSSILWRNVLNTITKTESLLRDRKFFHNSKAYRIKQRVVQFLLIIACDKQHESLILDENVYKWSLSSLKEVSHIHSVAYQLIWLLVLVYNKNPTYSDLWNDFNNAQENHNYLCSFISIIYHLLKIKNDGQFEFEVKKNILPFCFSNGYKIRFYAQETICMLLSNNNYHKSEWLLLCETMKNIIANNEQNKKYENPFNDFFYRELDVINSLSLKNVCTEVPRLLNIIYEERILAEWLNDICVNLKNNDKYDLSMCSVSSFIEKNTSLVTSNEIITSDNAHNAQRKYTPSQPQDENTTSSTLIVVASLIDKVTNLGGLARTCQVFGVSTLVVDSLTCIEKREFTALSMTAEKHQYITEVKVKNLKSFLQKKKNEGFQIVAAEQTVDSVKLHEIELPFKCVLVLGNETSGVPHDLLSIMDTCVEIEQLGIVRSLNVHVAGSLFIWEYTKQHCLKVSD